MFQQLGAIFEKQADSPEEFRDSNYVLVTSVYDDSIWVLWRKYVTDGESRQPLLAKDWWAGSNGYMGRYGYAEFPGMLTMEGERESVIYAKIANSWDSLQADIELRFENLYRVSSKGNGWDPEPVLVLANRTLEGGIRRQNDFRSCLLRQSRV